MIKLVFIEFVIYIIITITHSKISLEVFGGFIMYLFP